MQLGQKLVEQIAQKKNLVDQRVWALARTSSRVPLYAGPEAILRAQTVETWGERLSSLNITDSSYRRLALFYASAGRFLDQRELDLSLDMRQAFYLRHEESGAPEYARLPLKEKVEVDYRSQNQIFGEDLPNGLVF